MAHPATLGWALLAMAFSLLVSVVASLGLVRWDKSLSDYQFLFRNGDPAASSVLILGYLAVVLALVFAARLAGWNASDYLALVRPRGRYVLLFGLLCVLLPPLITFAHALQFDVSQLFNPHGFDRARAANGLAVHARWRSQLRSWKKSCFAAFFTAGCPNRGSALSAQSS